MKTTRPVLRWHGGKWVLAPWIISHLPEHKVYVEPFGGAGSVLMRKPRAYAEVWNDLDGSVVGLFRVLRDPVLALALIDALKLTPFARQEYEEAYLPTEDSVEAARRLVARSFMGFGSNSHTRECGFRANSNRSGSTPAHDWATYPAALARIVSRLQGVVIESRTAALVMSAHDSPETLHYVDPPYVKGTRTDEKDDYIHEMTDAEHSDLLAFLKTLQGKVVLSGYAHPLYDDALTGWRRVTRSAHADGAAKRTEVLWMNFASVQARLEI